MAAFAASDSDSPAAKFSVPKSVRYLIGGASGMMATSVLQPLDLIKNRMQLQGVGVAKGSKKNTLQILKSVLKNEGVRGIYKGLDAGLLRQATYTTTRLGTYTYLFERFSRDGKPPPFLTKVCMGMFSGACGAFIGTPAEVCLIRLMADGRLPAAERRNYKNVIDALARIVKEEGVTTLWRGAVATTNRGIVVNATQLATYSQMKQVLMTTGWFKENIKLHFCASMISGLITTTASLPLDIAKTRIQNMKYIKGKPEYKNTLDVLQRLIREEGVLSLWKGFTPYYCRLGPHTILIFVFLEQLTKTYFRWQGAASDYSGSSL